MKKRFLLLVILLIFLISLVTFFLILNYFDPYSSPVLAVFFITIIFLLLVSSFFTLVLYFFKKIHFRGEVYTYHVKTSFRQGFFIALFLTGTIAFKVFGAHVTLTSLLLGIVFVYLELFIQNLNNKNL